jgi:hypothetical protein
MNGTLELDELYSAFKQLTAAYAAAAILGTGDLNLEEEAGRLRDRARQAAEECQDPALTRPLRACAETLTELCHLDGAKGGSEKLRGMHRALRRQVWDVRGCEYVPCSLSAGQNERS